MNLSAWRLPGAGYEKTCVCDFAGTVIAGGRTGFVQGDEIFGLTLKPMEKGGGALSEMAQFNMQNTGG
jgi:reticulon-4-interacting protein 1, mitochondrial